MANRLLLLALLLCVTCPTAWAQDPAGAEFQVNSYIDNSQYRPAVAADADGNFVVVWESEAQDGSGYGVFGQRFSAAGLPQGGEFRVNSYITGTQDHPAVASDANGNFVVVWESNAQDGYGYGIFGQRFNASGVPQGSEFRANSYTTSAQRFPSAASDANGNFVVIWESYQDGNGYGIFGQRFNAAGVPQGSEFQVNSYNPGRQTQAAVTSGANGDFVVVWVSEPISFNFDIFGQRFDASGVPQGSEFKVNSYTPSYQILPRVGSDAQGNFVAVWESFNQDGSAIGVFGRRFNASGVPQAGEFRVNTYTAGIQRRPDVGMDADGNFVVAWESYAEYGIGLEVLGQRFDAGGLPQGPEVQVNSYAPSHQRLPAVASAANGNFVVAWVSYEQDGSSRGIFGQRYGDLIFEDGFE